MILYFTGTGNSRYVARMMAAALGDECVDAGPYIKSGEKPELSSGRPWVFVAPVYAWQMARVFAGFLRSARLCGSRKAYFVLTCGGDAGNAGAYAQSLCGELGMDYMGLLEVVMPENYVAMFPVPDEETSARIVRVAERSVRRGVQCVEGGRPFLEKKLRAADKLKSGPINQGFYKFYVHAKKFYTTEKCTLCGACQSLCPLNNIRLAEGRVQWQDNCTHCMACICYCPAEAIEYGRASVGKRRYRGPVYGED